jgi:hypothetical protein
MLHRRSTHNAFGFRRHGTAGSRPPSPRLLRARSARPTTSAATLTRNKSASAKLATLPSFWRLIAPAEQLVVRELTGRKLGSPEQLPGIDIPGQSARRYAAKIIDATSVRAIKHPRRAGISGEWKTSRRWRTIGLSPLLLNGVTDQRAGRSARGRPNRCPTCAPGSCCTQECSSPCSVRSAGPCWLFT